MKYITVFSLLAISAIAAPVARKTFPTKEDVQCRNGPNNAAGIVKTIKKGTQVMISCQIQGENVKGNNLWDRVGNCFVADFNIKTGTSSRVAPACAGSPGGGSPGGGSAVKHNLSNNGVNFIAGFERFCATFHNNAAGVKTIGFGHVCKPAASCNNIRAPISREQGKALLKKDALQSESCVNRLVKSKLNQNQFDALVSFASNLGCGKMENIATTLNKGISHFKEATEQMLRTANAGGHAIEGMKRRRQAEVNLFYKK